MQLRLLNSTRVRSIDLSQYIRWLNHCQSFLFWTQFFYKHLLDAREKPSVPGFIERSSVVDGEVARVPKFPYIPTFEIDLVHNLFDLLRCRIFS